MDILPYIPLEALDIIEPDARFRDPIYGRLLELEQRAILLNAQESTYPDM